MSAAAEVAVVFDLDVVFSFFEGVSYFFSSEDVSVKVLAKYLCGFIIDLVLGVYHDAIFSAFFVEDLADKLWVAGIYEHEARHLISSVSEQAFDLFWSD